MSAKKIGQRVKILSGLTEFIGKTGTIIDTEKYGQYDPLMYRVELDEPVDFEDIGMVYDDLWEGQYLQNIRS